MLLFLKMATELIFFVPAVTTRTKYFDYTSLLLHQSDQMNNMQPPINILHLVNVNSCQFQIQRNNDTEQEVTPNLTQLVIKCNRLKKNVLSFMLAITYGR